MRRLRQRRIESSAIGDDRQQPEERGRRARLAPLPLAQDGSERRVDEHQVVVGDQLRPVGRGEHRDGGEDRERQGLPRELACANELGHAEEHGETRAEDHRAVEVRPHDEQRQDEERPAADPAAGRVDEEPQDAREERQRRRLRPDRPAPRAGQDREQADDEGRAGRGASRPRGRGGEREREKDEEDAEQDHRAHPGERVRAVEDDLREPLLVGPRLASAEDRDRLRVREAVLDDLAARHQRQPRVADDDRGGEDGEEHDPDERDEQDREGARLERAAERAGCRRRLGGRGGGGPATSGRGSRARRRWPGRPRRSSSCRVAPV